MDFTKAKTNDRPALSSERTPYDNSYRNSQTYDLKSDNESKKTLDTKTDWQSVAKNLDASPSLS
jgi:hypothetical protein